MRMKIQCCTQIFFYVSSLDEVEVVETSVFGGKKLVCVYWNWRDFTLSPPGWISDVFLLAAAPCPRLAYCEAEIALN
ncbi:unnamed protein product [Cuscuta campestris]|uniref:Uncharacterized protein n=1 Tax=Cuscuta campestris TaxID=132261 RepID=A0A484N9C1_9ASTE|nr:unnamed protein product [Cuscuta campestris]